jgi:hypothetical protein
MAAAAAAVTGVSHLFLRATLAGGGASSSADCSMPTAQHHDSTS